MLSLAIPPLIILLGITNVNIEKVEGNGKPYVYAEFSMMDVDEFDCQDILNFAEQEGAATAEWKVYEDRRAGSIDSGVPIPDEGKFYGAVVGPGDVAVISTNPINLAGKQLCLKYYEATDGAQMKMCIYDEKEGSRYSDCGVESKVGWSESDLEWKTAVSTFDRNKLTEDAVFHFVCDNKNGGNYGACGFTDLVVVDGDGPPKCTP